MNILEKIKKVFSSEEITKEIVLRDAMQKLEEQVRLTRESNIKTAMKNSRQIYADLQDLREVFSMLEKEEVKDVSGKASQSVKNHFCRQAKNQIDLIEKPENEENVTNFLNETSKIMSDLGGLTNRQMVHIKFFFPEGVSPIYKKSEDINRNLQKTIKLFESEKSDVYHRIKEKKSQIKYLEDKIGSNYNSIKSARNDIKESENEIKIISLEIENTDVKEVEKSREILEKSENGKSRIEQEINSYLAFERLLKKIKHENKIKDDLLDSYINNPVSALKKDEDLRIIYFLKKTYRLNEDKKKLEKVRRVLDNLDKLKNLRKDVMDKEKEIHKCKKNLEKVLPLIEKKKRLEKELLSNKIKIKKAEEYVKSCEDEVQNTKKNIESLNEQIKEELSKVFNARIL